MKRDLSDGEASESDFDGLIGEEDDVSSINLSDFSETEKVLAPGGLPTVAATTAFLDGTPRTMLPEIDPVYDSDDSDREQFNTIGNLPLSAYEEFPHIGYDINGRRIMRPAAGSALDQLLELIDLPAGWTGLLDQNTGGALNISAEELELIKKIQKGENTTEINPYDDETIAWFSDKTEQMPVTGVPEPKRRFVPSKHEAKRVMKIVKAIREGRIVPNKKQEESEKPSYDLWVDNEAPAPDHVMTLRAPKLPPPTNAESYNPPAEYLLNDEERQQWEETEPMDRERNFVPQKYGALRKVPGYSESVRERFERCLDLYLAPRVRHQKLQIDPELLVPKLPSPQDLKPFPIITSVVYSGHKGRVRAVLVDPLGNWLATGGDDGEVRVWEVLTGRCMYKVQLSKEDPVESLEWNPEVKALLAAAVGETCVLVVVPVFGFPVENAARVKVEAGWGYATGGEVETKAPAQWVKPSPQQLAEGVAVVVEVSKTIKTLSWHRKGDYFLTTAPLAANLAVLIHQLSKHSLQLPFRKSKGIVVDAKFHPFRPHLYVASQRYIRVYDLGAQVMAKKLMPGARWLSLIAIHPRGDHVIAGSYDKRVLWHDMDLAATPYKTLRYHEKAVRSVAFHPRLPLMCSASDDAAVHVFHQTVYDDLMSNPLLVPLKKLAGHKVVNLLGVLATSWHPREAWLFTAGADGTARLWTT